MSAQVVVPLRPRTRPGYTDTAALNDIHTLLTATDPGDATLADIAVILTRTGRPMVAARDIEITTTETALGWPVACAQAGDTSVYIRQAPTGPGLLIEICTKSADEHDALTVTYSTDEAIKRPAPRQGATDSSGGLTPPLTITASDHEGGGWVQVFQIEPKGFVKKGDWFRAYRKTVLALVQKEGPALASKY